MLMNIMKTVITLALLLTLGLTLDGQVKKDTTVLFKLRIHCPSCKAKLDKNMPFEKGIKNYKLNMKDTTVLLTFRVGKNTVAGLKAAIERNEVQVLGSCDKNGKLLKCHQCCKNAKEKGHPCACGKKGQAAPPRDSTCGDNCCSRAGNTGECCKNQKK